MQWQNSTLVYIFISVAWTDGPTDGPVSQGHNYLYQGVENNVRKFSIWKTCRLFGNGPDGNFFWPQILGCAKFFNALWAGLTNPRDISDSFNENPLLFSPCKTVFIKHELRTIYMTVIYVGWTLGEWTVWKKKKGLGRCRNCTHDKGQLLTHSLTANW